MARPINIQEGIFCYYLTAITGCYSAIPVEVLLDRTDGIGPLSGISEAIRIVAECCDLGDSLAVEPLSANGVPAQTIQQEQGPVFSALPVSNC